MKKFFQACAILLIAAFCPDLCEAGGWSEWKDFAGVWIRYSDIGQSEGGLLCRHLVRAEIKNTTENNITSLKIICTICDTRTGKKVSEITLPKQGGSPITIKGKTSASILFGVNYQSDWTYQHEKSSGSEACSFEIGDIVLTR